MRDLAVFAALAVVLFVLGYVTSAWDRLNEGLRLGLGDALGEVYGAVSLAAVAMAGLWIRRARQGTREAQRRADVQERFRAVIEEVPAITYTWDPTHPAGTSAVPYVSPQVETILGYTPQEWKADPMLWIDHLHPEDRVRVVDESNRTDRTGEPFEMEYRTIAKDGREVWLHDESVVVARDGHGRPLRVQGVMFDITPQKRAEESLREAEFQYRSLVEHLPAVVYIDAVDESSTATYVSPQYERLLGFTSEERLADPELWLRQLHPEDRDRVQAESLRTNATGDPFDCEYRMLTKDGRVVWLRDHAFLVGGDDGRPPFWQGVLLDITAAKLAEEALSRRDVILEATGFAAAAFLNALAWTDVIDEALERLGTAAEASHAYVFQNSRDPERGSTATERCGWVAQTPVSAPPNGFDRVIAYEDGFERWHRMLQAGEVIHGATRSFPDPERRQLLDREGIASMVVMPITVDDEWWGFIGFDDRMQERVWQPAEIDALSVAANTLGAAIGRERAARRIAETEIRYRSLVEQIPAITYIEEPSTGRAIYMSPQLETVLGYTQQDLQQGQFWDSIHDDDRARVQAEDERTNATGEPYRVQYRQRTKDGRWVWIRDEATLVRDRRGHPLFWQGVKFDVTEEKVAEEQLRDAEQRFRAIVEHIPAVVYVDPIEWPAETVYVSPELERMLGITAEEWVSDVDSWERAIAPDDRETIVRDYLVFLETAGQWSREYRFIARDGRVVWVHDEATILRNEQGLPSFVQGVWFDITERKLAEEALQESEQREREAAERLRALDEMKNTFLAAVSHELRSPLTSILGLSITLERHQDMDQGDREDLLGRLSTNARKLDRLLKDLLDIDRLSRGIVTPIYQVTDVGALARRTVENLESLAHRSIAVETSSVVISVDPAKVERIVENLLVNAARHTRDDRRIWLRVEPLDNGVLIAVEDDGAGVPEELADAIFEPFLQGPTISSHSPGTGIGLSLVSRFAALHGGRAWVEPRTGGGASFRVFLPCGPVSAGEGPGEEAEPILHEADTGTYTDAG
ncbi:MAG: PAS domain-containing protein [Actinomycetota bacterium]